MNKQTKKWDHRITPTTVRTAIALSGAENERDNMVLLAMRSVVEWSERPTDGFDYNRSGLW